MFAFTSRVGVGLAMMSIVLVPAEGAAAKPACPVGKWVLIGVSGYTTTSGDKVKRRGAAGVRLTIGSKNGYFDFTESDPLVSTGFIRSYDGHLKTPVDFWKARDGGRLISFDYDRPTGAATYIYQHGDGEETPVRVAKSMRKGYREYLIPDTARYTCTKTRLVTKVRLNMLGVKTGDTLTFRRVKK